MIVITRLNVRISTLDENLLLPLQKLPNHCKLQLFNIWGEAKRACYVVLEMTRCAEDCVDRLHAEDCVDRLHGAWHIVRAQQMSATVRAVFRACPYFLHSDLKQCIMAVLFNRAPKILVVVMLFSVLFKYLTLLKIIWLLTELLWNVTEFIGTEWSISDMRIQPFLYLYSKRSPHLSFYL